MSQSASALTSLLAGDARMMYAMGLALWRIQSHVELPAVVVPHVSASQSLKDCAVTIADVTDTA